MKSLYAALAAGSILAAGGMAQEEHAAVFDKMGPQIKVMGLQGSMMGKTVKGAPYSAVEVNETTQMLADGTRIHNESQTQVFRDSEGRLRRETPNEVTIWDPVANASWVLNPKTQTARKLPMGTFSYTTIRDPNGAVLTNTVRGLQTFEAGTVHMEETRIAESKLGEAREKLAADKMKAEIETQLRANGAGTAGRMVTGGGVFVESKSIASRKGNTEPLGRKMIEGVNADGTRFVTTIEAGA